MAKVIQFHARHRADLDVDAEGALEGPPGSTSNSVPQSVLPSPIREDYNGLTMSTCLLYTSDAADEYQRV